ncbi:hypothetical protein GCM10022214_30580 [Actinomadura miaoliensis]|uniref:AB hydrolase-1 domain-containing protein n=1 Tax=Actinomadura miaoliensis TaxID=430685 RepID=A0ABP7VRF3_9ACTN
MGRGAPAWMWCSSAPTSSGPRSSGASTSSGSTPAGSGAAIRRSARSQYPRDAEAYQRLVSYHQRRAQACRRLTGPLFDHVDTRSVARDLEAVRRALGERRISVVGASYGTLLGQLYAEEFPHRLRALVLDSNVDYSVTDARRHLTSASTAMEQAYRRFAAWCATSPRCALTGQDAIKVLDELMARAERGDLDDPDRPGSTLSPEDLAARIHPSLASSPSWEDLAQDLAGLDTGTRARAEDPGTTPDPTSPIYCSDFRFTVRGFGDLQRLKAASRAAAPHMRINPGRLERRHRMPGLPAPVPQPATPVPDQGHPADPDDQQPTRLRDHLPGGDQRGTSDPHRDAAHL